MAITPRMRQLYSWCSASPGRGPLPHGYREGRLEYDTARPGGDSAGTSAPGIEAAKTKTPPEGGAVVANSAYTLSDTSNGSRVDMHHVRRRGAKTDNSPTARRLLLHLDSQVAHAAFAH